MNVLVTGCAGFIGSHLCDALLKEGHHVTGMDNFDPFYARTMKERNLEGARRHNAFHFIEMDIRSSEAWSKVSMEIDCVIHLAAKAGVRPSIAHPAEYVSVNIGGTQTLLEWMTQHTVRTGRKLVFGSSSSVYGNQTKVPFDEDDRVDRPISPYAFTKKSGELLVHTYHHLHGLDVVSLRLFTVYGPRQRPDLAIHRFTKLLLEGKPLPVFGDGSTGRDYTYVDDTVSGILSAMHYVVGHENVFEIINLGNNHPVLLRDLIKALEEVTGIRGSIESLPMQPGDVEQTWANITRAKQLLEYHPDTDLHDGLKHFLEWFRSLA